VLLLLPPYKGFTRDNFGPNRYPKSNPEIKPPIWAQLSIFFMEYP
jgi:hypothetical protein